METPEDIAELIRANWGSKTLADFRLEAESSQVGGVFEALRGEDDRRTIIILCATRKADIRRLAKALVIPKDLRSTPVDWSSHTLLDVMMSAPEGAAFAFCIAPPSAGRRGALLLLAHTPRSIAKVEQALGFPP